MKLQFICVGDAILRDELWNDAFDMNEKNDTCKLAKSKPEIQWTQKDVTSTCKWVATIDLDTMTIRSKSQHSKCLTILENSIICSKPNPDID